MSDKETTRAGGFFEGVLETLADKHSQLDISLQNLRVDLPNTRLSVEVNGMVTVTAHVRNLTDDERKASSDRNVALMTRA